MELDELQCQEQIRQELITAETTHQNLKKDYDKLQVEHQQVRYQMIIFKLVISEFLIGYFRI